MPRLPVLSARELIRMLEQVGFQVVRQRGNHVRLKHEDGRVLTVPVHRGRISPAGYLGRFSVTQNFHPRI